MTATRHLCAIQDPVPAYRQGLARELHFAGYETAEAPDGLAWVRSLDRAEPGGPCRRAVLLSVRHDSDVAALAALSATDRRVALVALLVDPSVEEFHRVLQAGAWGAVDYAAAPEEIVATLAATWVGAIRLPRGLVAELLGRRRAAAAPCPVGDGDVARLIALADGWSIERLADHENFSTREMFRRLQGLYRSLGVANRHQAVAVAARSGLLDGWRPTGGLSSKWRTDPALAPAPPSSEHVPAPRALLRMGAGS